MKLLVLTITACLPLNIESAAHLVTDTQPAHFLAPAAVPADADLLNRILEPCSERPSSHICDPEHLLSGDAFDTQSEVLRRLSEVKHASQCPGHGYETYVALLSVPPEDIHAAARELG